MNCWTMKNGCWLWDGGSSLGFELSTYLIRRGRSTLMMGYVKVDKGHDVENNLMDDLNPKVHASEGRGVRHSKSHGMREVGERRRNSRR